MRRLEFLSLTANPIDMNIVGVEGRAAILRSLADDLGLPGEEIVPDDEKLYQMQQQMAAQQQAGAAVGDQGTPPSIPDGAGRVNEQLDNASRNRAVNVAATRNLG